MQMPGRSPAMTAMTAMSLDHLTGGRFILGLGPSGPQVSEGWHGVPYGRPLTRTKEYISIIRKILAREERLTHEGFHYQIPFTGAGASGLGKPLKSILHGDPSLKILTGAFTPGGVRTAAEVADGFFPVWMNPERFDVFEDALADGFAKAPGGKGLGGKGLDTFDIMPFVTVCLGDDLEACRMKVKRNLALYVGGMGARGRNFYNDYTKRLGHEAAAVKIQDLFLDGKHKEAALAVPDDYVDQIALVGPRERIVERLQVWREAAAKGHVSAILLSEASLDAVRLIAEEVL